MRTRVLLSLLVLLAAAPAAAQQTRAFRSTAGVSLELPAGWTRAPEETMAMLRRRLTATGSTITYEAGFRAGDAPFPAPPMVVIGFAPLPRRTTLEQFGADFGSDEAQEEAQATADGRMPGVNVSTMRWDAQNGIGWVRAAFPEGQAIGYSLMAATLLPSGDRMFAVVYYGVRGDDEARVRADLTAALRSLRAD
ncbi:hypothetical protein [Longimicrobium sp.]|uniref:hypothetical protein n=1 Tax=Longimicrobium sp. TaxID=2029185 RepID=UPI002E3731AB|nr:hypothetical protein [Longimicrobium sp.]HEX6041956.1 hypothetical protein [Longimicrobium sp.]